MIGNMVSFKARQESGCETNHLVPFNAKVKNLWSYTSVLIHLGCGAGFCFNLVPVPLDLSCPAVGKLQW